MTSLFLFCGMGVSGKGVELCFAFWLAGCVVKAVYPGASRALYPVLTSTHATELPMVSLAPYRLRSPPAAAACNYTTPERQLASFTSGVCLRACVSANATVCRMHFCQQKILLLRH